MSWIENQGSTTSHPLTEAERNRMLVEWNRTEALFAERELCLHQLFEVQAAIHPNWPAVAFEGERISYGEANLRADHLARRLRRLGARPDVPVALCLERSIHMVVGLLAILKSGAGYLPIDPALPAERIAFMLEDAHSPLLLTQTALVASLPAGNAQVLCIDSAELDGQGDALDDADAEGEYPQPHPGSLAYVIYTSGSTGQPKGVCIEHRNIVNYVLGVTERLRLEPGMRHAMVSTLAADLGNTVLYPALVTGGCLHVIAQARSENPELLAEYFEQEHIDVLKIVPSHLAALHSVRHPERIMPRRRLVLGGEASRLDWIDRLRKLAPACEIFNHYGPTETTVGVLTFDVGRGPLPSTASDTLPLGRPLPNCRIYLLDAEGEPVRQGELGELCIGGHGVARGYLFRRELTAEKFRADPFSTEPGARLYRSGDLARWLPDGSVEFCGRIDHQVKINGYRVELGEIESTLARHPGVAEALVVPQENGEGQKSLVAYVVPHRADQPLWNAASHLLPDGAPVAHLNKNETDYIYNEIFVLQAYLRHGITLSEGDCVLDAGANIGLFSVFACRLANKLKLFSFEPNPAAYACLQANAEAWGGNCEVQCLAHGLSRENKSAELTFFEGLSLLSGFYADAATEKEVVRNYVANQDPGVSDDPALEAEVGRMIDDRLRARTVSAQLRTLSQVIADHGLEQIDLLKINVEKSELDVLLGLGTDDWPKLRQLVIEVDRQENLEPITALLQRHGFQVVVEQDPLLQNTDLCYVYAKRPWAAAAEGAYPRPVPAPDGTVLTPMSLRRHLADTLPPYMLPAGFVLLEKFPRNANGKIERRALPPLTLGETSGARSLAAPRNETEQRLAAIWRELLQVEALGIEDDFFDMGGQSLLAIRAVARIREAFGVDLLLRNLFEHPTIAGLGTVIDELLWVAQGQSVSGSGEREEIEL
ncbi:MAG TPA: amino acid adenylation domain-containing protein [Rhodocyclaceae bacterium]|nr:amino acid adenylation domain-containing protein [Rhodocyclaceae bacterium]